MEILKKALPVITFLLGAGGVWIATPSETQIGTALDVANAQLEREVGYKKELMKKHILLSKRLKEEPDIDLSFATSLEWEQAALDKAAELGITDAEVLQLGAHSAIQVKAGELSILCNDPNSTVKREEINKVVNPW